MKQRKPFLQFLRIIAGCQPLAYVQDFHDMNIYHRICDGKAVFCWRDYMYGNQMNLILLDAEEFIRRFLLPLWPLRSPRQRKRAGIMQTPDRCCSAQPGTAHYCAAACCFYSAAAAGGPCHALKRTFPCPAGHAFRCGFITSWELSHPAHLYRK